MKQAILAIAAMVFAAAAAGACPAQQPKPVHGEGCVQAGVEAYCLVLKDLKSGTLYDLLIKGARPPVGLGIEFTGIPRAVMTTCMQGTPLEVTNWARKDSLKCAPGEASKH
ncbi:MAG: hypothetical protein ACRD27_11890 [Terracidiphilus sp.]